MVLVFRWPRGVGMVRKWKWYRLLWFWSSGGLGGWAWLENGNGIGCYGFGLQVA